MTVAQRMRSIRLMEKMEKSDICVKDENGTLKYLDKNGESLIEAKLTEKA